MLRGAGRPVRATSVGEGTEDGRTEAETPETTGGDPFDAVDPRLNVFALANGMDLVRDAGKRRLEWFTDGLERGIVIEVDGPGAFRVEVQAWRTGASEISERATVGGHLSAEDLGQILASAIEAANDLS